MELTPPLQTPEAPLPLQPPPEGLHPANYPTLGQFLKKHSPGEGARQPGQDFTPWDIPPYPPGQGGARGSRDMERLGVNWDEEEGEGIFFI